MILDYFSDILFTFLPTIVLITKLKSRSVYYLSTYALVWNRAYFWYARYSQVLPYAGDNSWAHLYSIVTKILKGHSSDCLLYTSDAADE